MLAFVCLNPCLSCGSETSSPGSVDVPAASLRPHLLISTCRSLPSFPFPLASGSKYEGWYNVREETFVTENEAKLADYKDPASGLPLKKMEETSYFFRMSKYRDALIQHIQASPSFILPDTRRNSILSRLEEELTDLSISRTTFDWGIPVPENFAPAHVLYVWFDALSNYLTGIRWLDPAAPTFWPADVHVIGKDIIWFHCVIWPTILMSANLPLPTSVFAHGFIHDRDGRKMR